MSLRYPQGSHRQFCTVPYGSSFPSVKPSKSYVKFSNVLNWLRGQVSCGRFRLAWDLRILLTVTTQQHSFWDDVSASLQ